MIYGKKRLLASIVFILLFGLQQSMAAFDDGGFEGGGEAPKYVYISSKELIRGDVTSGDLNSLKTADGSKLEIKTEYKSGKGGGNGQNMNVNFHFAKERDLKSIIIRLSCTTSNTIRGAYIHYSDGTKSDRIAIADGDTVLKAAQHYTSGVTIDTIQLIIYKSTFLKFTVKIDQLVGIEEESSTTSPPPTPGKYYVTGCTIHTGAHKSGTITNLKTLDSVYYSISSVGTFDVEFFFSSAVNFNKIEFKFKFADLTQELYSSMSMKIVFQDGTVQEKWSIASNTLYVLEAGKDFTNANVKSIRFYAVAEEYDYVIPLIGGNFDYIVGIV